MRCDDASSSSSSSRASSSSGTSILTGNGNGSQEASEPIPSASDVAASIAKMGQRLKDASKPPPSSATAELSKWLSTFEGNAKTDPTTSERCVWIVASLAGLKCDSKDISTKMRLSKPLLQAATSRRSIEISSLSCSRWLIRAKPGVCIGRNLLSSRLCSKSQMRLTKSHFAGLTPTTTV